MKNSRTLFTFVCLLFSFPSAIVSATEYTLTTKTTDGGFDYWGDIRSGGNLTPSGTFLSVGNTLGNSNPKAVSILMFDLSSFTLAPNEAIQSVELSYYLTSAWGSSTGTIFHSTKEEATMNWNSDIASSLSPSGWSLIGTASANTSTGGDRTARIDVTNWFVSDLAGGVSYTAFRIAQADVYGAKNNDPAWGFRIASSENSGGYLVPTLTITTQAIPEPAGVALLAGISMLGFIIFRSRLRY